MAYTTNCGFKHDVFVSYAHADDEELFGSIRWVSNFVDDLNKYLKRRLGTRAEQIPSVWKDKKLARNIPLDTALSNAIKEAATYIIIMSPAYLQSEWCKKERQQLTQILKENGANTRVFLVEIDEVERKSYPEEIDENLVPFKFWKKEEGSDVARTLGIPKREEEEYCKIINDVAYDLAKELELIRNSETGGVVSIKRTYKGTVFLAQVTDDLGKKREGIKRYLKDLGYKILPEENGYAGYEPDWLKNYMEQNLSACTLYVQLLSDLEGRTLSGSNEFITTFQFKIAEASKKRIMVWRDSGLKLEEVSDTGLINILKSEYVRTDVFEEFKSAIIAQVPDPTIKPDRPKKSSKFVYICTELADKEYCKSHILPEIRRRNQEANKSTINCFFPLDNGQPHSDKKSQVKQARKYHMKGLLKSDAILFVYCNSEPNTVLFQVLYCARVITVRKKPIEIVGVYDGPPPQKATIELYIDNFKFEYLNCRDSLNEFIEKFLNHL